MADRWIVTPQYFEHAEPALRDSAPADAIVNGPHVIPDREAGSMARLHRPIADFVAKAIREGDRPVSLAGDCCAAAPALAGCQAAGLDPWLVWIDAHGDFNTPETSPSQFLGGMPLAMMVGRGPQWMCESVGLTPIDEARVLLVDARDLDPLEAEAVTGSALRHIPLDALGRENLPGPVMVHIDMDVIDATDAPAFNYPVAGGPGAGDVARSLGALASIAEIACVSVSAWSPSKDADGKTGQACRSALAPLFA